MTAICLISALLADAAAIQVTESGRVSVSPLERDRERRVQTLLREAEIYYKTQPDEVRTSIEKHKAVLRESNLHPAIRENTLFKLANLYERAASFSGSLPAREEYLMQAAKLYVDITTTCLDKTRPVLLADTLLRAGEINRNLRKTGDAAQCFLDARKIACDVSLPAEDPAAGERRLRIQEASLRNLIMLLEDPVNTRLRQRVIRESAGDEELQYALGQIATGKDTPTSTGPNAGQYRLLIAVITAALTVVSVSAMRRGLQQLVPNADKGGRRGE